MEYTRKQKERRVSSGKLPHEYTPERLKEVAKSMSERVGGGLNERSTASERTSVA